MAPAKPTNAPDNTKPQPPRKGSVGHYAANDKVEVQIADGSWVQGIVRSGNNDTYRVQLKGEFAQEGNFHAVALRLPGRH